MTLALVVVAFCLYKFTPVGVVPLLVLAVGRLAIGVVLWVYEGAPSRRQLR